MNINFKKIIIIISVILVVILITSGIYFWLLYKKVMQPVKIIYYDSNLTIYLGGGCNSVVLTSADGKKALVVDTKFFKGAKMLWEEIKTPNVTIINTHFHLDHSRGNKLYPTAYVISGAVERKLWDIDSGHSKYPDKILNSGEEKVLNFGNERVHVLNMGRAHSLNDSVVYFEKRKIIITGDIVWVNMHPAIPDKSSNITSWIKVLDILYKKYDIKVLIPGHGYTLSDKNAILKMKEYFTSITNAIRKKEKLELLEKQYEDYIVPFPIFSGFNRTVKFIKNESK